MCSYLNQPALNPRSKRAGLGFRSPKTLALTPTGDGGLGALLFSSCPRRSWRSSAGRRRGSATSLWRKEGKSPIRSTTGRLRPSPRSSRRRAPRILRRPLKRSRLSMPSQRNRPLFGRRRSPRPPRSVAWLLRFLPRSQSVAIWLISLLDSIGFRRHSYFYPKTLVSTLSPTKWCCWRKKKGPIYLLFFVFNQGDLERRWFQSIFRYFLGNQCGRFS